MNLLFHILRAGHASGTHHKLALDALRHVEGSYAERWQRLLLQNSSLYLEGSKAPDNQFKDFKNHVLHVRDGLWGGAPEKAANWYQHLLAALRDKNWGEASWCAGVLSHYYTDPIHPFHTGQSDAENNVHRAVEWSISRSYDKLADLGERSLPKLDLHLSTGDDWLRTLIIAGATRANKQYEALLAHYDFQRGVVDPPSGLDQTAQAFVGDLIQYAALSFAQVLQRAFAESAVVPPDVGLTAATLLATIKLPIKAVLKRIDDRELRREVEAMYDELQATGRVDKSMPEDERVVRALHAKEILAKTNPPGPHKLDVTDGASATKVRGERAHRPVAPSLQPSATAPVSAATTAAVKPASTLRPTPPAPPVTDFPPKRATPQIAAVRPTPVASKPAPDVAPVVRPAEAAEPTETPEAVAPEAVREIAKPAVEPAAEQKVGETETPVQDTVAQEAAPAPAAEAAPTSPPLDAGETISAPLATAAATAAASAMSGLGSMGLAGRLWATGPTAPDSQQADLRPASQVRHPSAVPQIALRPPRPVLTAVRPAEAPDTRTGKPAASQPAHGVSAVHIADDARCHLAPEQDVVDAPSIGPKTADRLKEVGVKTVADLFSADPGALAEELGVAHIRAKTIAEWQDQARLVCEVAGLRGTHAQLLVGAGYRDARRIARAEARQLCADVLRFAQSSDGQRVLRSGGAPDIEKIASWVAAAERALASKAA